MNEHEKPFLYKKTLVGQRGYKSSIPRFIAISEYGICIKWNANIPYSDFYKEASTKLIEYTDGGLDWLVCVLFKENPTKFDRIKTFFKVEFSVDDYLNWNKTKKENKELFTKIKKIMLYVCKNSYLRIVSTQKEFNDTLEKLLQDL